jgi:hypothetical protein
VKCWVRYANAGATNLDCDRRRISGTVLPRQNCRFPFCFWVSGEFARRPDYPLHPFH